MRLKAKASGTNLGSAFGTQIAIGNKKYPTPSTATAVDAKTGASVTSYSAGNDYFITWEAATSDSTVITITGDTFPGNYYVVGDTYARSEITGKDEFFQFVIPKAKITAENTITLEAEGDPSVFNLNLRVLRPTSGEMMKLIKYSLTEGTD
jgi:hypothetical protein